MKSFTNATVEPVANIYFEGNVVSHTVVLEDGSRKTLGIIAKPGTYHFATAAAECMEIISGNCDVIIDGSDKVETYQAGSSFNVAANSGFDIIVKEDTCQYICSYLS